MPRFFLVVIMALAVMPLSSCGLFKKWLQSRKKPPVSGNQSKDMFLGVIESVNPEQKFVLVRMDLRLGIAPGTKLDVRSASGTKATLMVTPERKMNFLSADITDGLPAVGDIVILPHQPEALVAPAASGTQPAPAASTPDLIPGVPPPEETGALPPPVP